MDIILSDFRSFSLLPDSGAAEGQGNMGLGAMEMVPNGARSVLWAIGIRLDDPNPYSSL